MQAINLQAVVDSRYPAVLRAAAGKLMQREYLDVGTFLKELPDGDLDDLFTRAAKVTASIDTQEDLNTLTILAGMLVQAEGGSLEGSVEKRTTNLIILLTFEDLDRKGVVEFHREKATLVNDDLDASIAQLK